MDRHEAHFHPLWFHRLCAAIRRFYQDIAAPSHKMTAVAMCLLSAVAVWGCGKTLPETDPKGFASPAPGKAFQIPDQKRAEPLQDEIKPAVPREPAPGGKPLTLAQLVDTALHINPNTQAAWERARAAAAEWGIARGGYYPTVSGRVSGSGGKMPVISPIGPLKGMIGEVGLSLSYLLLDFGGREATAEAARQALIAANWNHNQAIQDLLRNVPQAYYRYLGNKARVHALEIGLNEAMTGLRSTEERKKAGVSTIADVLQARARVDQIRLELVAGRGAVQVSRGQLATAVGWPANTAFDVVEAPDDLPLHSMEQQSKDLIDLALSDRPDLAAARAAVRQGEAELRKAESALLPRLIATGNTGWAGVDGKNEGRDIEENAANYYGGIALEFPLFEGFALQNRVRKAAASLEAARAALRGREELVIADVWSGYHYLHTAMQEVETSETLLVSSEESYRVSLGRYRAGAADIVELLNAQSQLAAARAQKVEARTRLFTSHAELVHAIGASLSEYPSVKASDSVPQEEKASRDRP